MSSLMRHAAALSFGIGALCGPAGAASLSVVDADHVTLRLLAEAPDAAGIVRGAIVVDLEPGWKTYWRDPGEAGLPPQLDFSGLGAAPTLSFPPPHRFDDGYSISNGYDAPMAIAFEAKVGEEPPAEPIAVSVALGVCQSVCVPVSAALTLDRADLPAPGSEPLVAWAFAALPDETDEGVTAALPEGSDQLVVAIDLPEAAGAAADLFVAGPAGWNFGIAQARPTQGGPSVFDVPILARPKADGANGLAVDIVLTSGETAILSRATAVDIR